MAIARGDRVQATTAGGSTITMVALGGPEPGHLFEIVWLATEDEWARAEQAADEADAVPWPTSAVREMTSA